ncbi:MAG: ATPase [Clostridia bacterium]|nr:ATPase [Clostridia bacterium]
MKKDRLLRGETSLGIEFGSTRIKAVLLDDDGNLLASGNHEWENTLDNGLWTYSDEAIRNGLRSAYAALKTDVKARYGVTLTTVGVIGISAMMHGYLAFDASDNLLAPFRTWRNTNTGEAAEKLSKELDFNIPLRWSVAHLEQTILNGEAHVKDIAFLTTLAGYIHYLLTGEKVLGVGDASGMFPIDSEKNDYDQKRVDKFNALHINDGFKWDLRGILPKVLAAGDAAGRLTESGARLIDPAGDLKAGVPFCPPEGDAGTGMTATDSIAARTGNISAGTSVFAMLVLEHPLSKVYPEIDMVTTPDGKPVAMVHCNNCTSDIDAWVRLFGEVLRIFGASVKKGELYDAFYAYAMHGESDCGGVVSYNLLAGEPLLGLETGAPMVYRSPDAKFDFANVSRSLLFSSFAALRVGMEILTEKENVKIDKLLGHGGLFKTEKVAQSLIASALGIPVSVMPSASEGGAWGIAILAQYSRLRNKGETLDAYLENRVFSKIAVKTEHPVASDARGFNKYFEEYLRGLSAEKALAEN